jgi:uncharacterized protein YecT (DUF1311 family)
MLKRIVFCLFFVAVYCNSYSQTQMELNEKEANNFKAKDAELNKVYKRLAAMITMPKEKDMLLKAQRAWISYRDSHCALTESAYDGGSVQPLVYFACMREVTEQRIKELKALIDDRSQK